MIPLITPQAWSITIVGWLIVFFALVCLIIIFTQVPKLLNINIKSKLRKQGKEHVAAKVGTHEPISGEETAAIAMALNMYMNEQHDEESGVLTIQRIQRRYSPWSSKIYGLNNLNK